MTLLDEFMTLSDKMTREFEALEIARTIRLALNDLDDQLGR